MSSSSQKGNLLETETRFKKYVSNLSRGGLVLSWMDQELNYSREYSQTPIIPFCLVFKKKSFSFCFWRDTLMASPPPPAGDFNPTDNWWMNLIFFFFFSSFPRTKKRVPSQSWLGGFSLFLLGYTHWQRTNERTNVVKALKKWNAVKYPNERVKSGRNERNKEWKIVALDLFSIFGNNTDKRWRWRRWPST